jgi:hypothetical protein
LITIQPSRFFKWQSKPGFGHHGAQQDFFEKILHAPSFPNLVVNNRIFQTLLKKFGQQQKKFNDYIKGHF